MTPRIQIVGRLPVDLSRRVRAAAKATTRQSERVSYRGAHSSGRGVARPAREDGSRSMGPSTEGRCGSARPAIVASIPARSARPPRSCCGCTCGSATASSRSRSQSASCSRPPRRRCSARSSTASPSATSPALRWRRRSRPSSASWRRSCRCDARCASIRSACCGPIRVQPRPGCSAVHDFAAAVGATAVD